MKKIVFGILVGLCIALPIQVISDNMVGKTVEVEVPVKVNGEYLLVNAIGIEGTTYAPVRALAESVTADVYWDGEAREVIIETKKEDITIPSLEETEENIMSEEEILMEISIAEREIEINQRQKFSSEKFLEVVTENSEPGISTEETINKTKEKIAKFELAIEREQQRKAQLEAQLQSLRENQQQ